MPRRYPGPALSADAVWVHRGRVLLVRRGRPPFRGLWALPGGYVELREKVEHAVERELFEETGLRGRAGPIVGVYSGPGRNPLKSTATVVYLIRGRPATPRAGDDAAGAAWVPLGGAAPLAFDHDVILRDALRLLRSGAGRRARRRNGRPRRRGSPGPG
jgi:8-oxo-dGTP diphosphatase